MGEVVFRMLFYGNFKMLIAMLIAMPGACFGCEVWGLFTKRADRKDRACFSWEIVGEWFLILTLHVKSSCSFIVIIVL